MEAEAAAGFVLPAQYSEDLKDENGNPMSKRRAARCYAAPRAPPQRAGCAFVHRHRNCVRARRAHAAACVTRIPGMRRRRPPAPPLPPPHPPPASWPPSEYKKRVKLAEKEKEKAEKAVSSGGGERGGDPTARHAVELLGLHGGVGELKGGGVGVWLACRVAVPRARRPACPACAPRALCQPPPSGATHTLPSPPPRTPHKPLTPAPAPGPSPRPPAPGQAKKAADAAAQPAAAPKKAALLDDSTEELDPTLYFENRVKWVEGRKARGANPYPHKFPVTTSVPDYVAQYGGLEAGAQLKDVTVALAGAARAGGGVVRGGGLGGGVGGGAWWVRRRRGVAAVRARGRRLGRGEHDRCWPG